MQQLQPVKIFSSGQSQTLSNLLVVSLEPLNESPQKDTKATYANEHADIGSRIPLVIANKVDANNDGTDYESQPTHNHSFHGTQSLSGLGLRLRLGK